jgi:SsrA-binding protein
MAKSAVSKKSSSKKKSSKKSARSSGPPQIRNKRAFHEYHVLEKVDAGIALQGTEVKSIRDGKITLGESYVRVDNDEVYLVNCHIPEYKPGSWTNHDPNRKRKLLLHRKEIVKLRVRIEEKGLTIVPLRLFFNQRGYAKIEIGVCRGKQLHDKRQAMKERDANRDIARQISGRE